jgi:transposase InsO family protein
MRSETIFVTNPANLANMALTKMGNGHNWLDAPSLRKFEVCYSSSQILSKWIETKALATITSTMIQKFFWQNIICYFGVPKSLTIDNGTQFNSKAFRTFCSQVGTHMHFALIRHSESNGLVERANGIIIS